MPHFYCTNTAWFCFSLYAAVVFFLHNSPAGNCTNHATLNAAIKKINKKKTNFDNVSHYYSNVAVDTSEKTPLSCQPSTLHQLCLLIAT